MLGRAPASARIHPCLEWSGDLGSLLDELGRRGVLQAMVEGGSTVVRALHDQDLIDRYVVYLAPALIGGRDMVPLLSGPSAPSIDSVWRGRFVAMTPLGDDVRLDLVPADRCT